MDYLYVCNTSSDFVSQISLGDYSHKKIYLNSKEGRVGPHGICTWKSEIIVANSYNNSISKIDIVDCVEKENYYIGIHCNDVDVFNNYAYIVCGESNSIIVFDLITNVIIQEIPCGNMPHNIDISRKSELGVIANMQSDCVSILDCAKNDILTSIKVGAYPTKAIITSDNKYIIVCESNLGLDKVGSITVFDLVKFKKVITIKVGKSPVDVYYDYIEKMCFVSNFLEGTISIVDLSEGKEVRKIKVGGMPRGIIKKGRYLYIGNNYGNSLIIYDIYKMNIKTIPIGKEPNGMTMV